jgi:hypothetical protein
MDNLVCAWHTPDPFYTGLAKRLKSQLDAVGQPSQIYRIEPAGDWRENNLLIKARVVQRAMSEYPESQLLFLDVDAIVRGPVAPLFDALHSCDAAFCFRHKRSWGTKFQVLGRAYLFNPTPNARELARLWVAECESGLAENEEAAVAAIMSQQPVSALIGCIPPFYSCREIGKEPEGAVLVHQSAHDTPPSAWKRIEQSARRKYRSLVSRSRE